jgi:hypothetical protein
MEPLGFKGVSVSLNDPARGDYQLSCVTARRDLRLQQLIVRSLTGLTLSHKVKWQLPSSDRTATAATKWGSRIRQ